MKQLVLTALTTAGILYVLFAAALTLGQRAIIYPVPNGPIASTGGFELISYRTSDGLDLTAGYRPAEAGKPTILYFHGNGTVWPSSIVATDTMVPAGYGVLAAEYRGYAGNPGSPSEEGLYRDGRAAMAWLRDQGIDGQDIVIIGNSIGSGVATKLASESGPAALVLISPFASLEQLAGEKLWWLPTSLLLRDRYDNVASLEAVTAPTLVMHGDADSLIPASHGEQLAKSKQGIEFALFEGVGHDLAWHQGAEARALEFMERVVER